MLELVLDETDSLQLPGEAARELTLSRGEAAIRLGRSLDARPALQALLDTPDGDAARWWLAMGALDRGDVAAATAALRRLWIASDDDALHEAAARALQEIGSPIGHLRDEADRAFVEERAAALRAATRHAEALDLVLALRVARGQAETDAELGGWQFRAKRYADAATTWLAVYGPPETAAAAPQALFELGLALSRSGRHDEALRVYRRLFAAHPTSPQADEASFKLGYVEMDRQDLPSAIARFDEHLRRFPNGHFAESAAWFAGWCAWRGGDRDDALARWAELLRAHPSTDLAPAIAYWRARAVGLAGQPESEATALREVLRAWPRTAYAWHASARLGWTWEPMAVSDAPSLAPLSNEVADRAEALLRAGFARWAADEARAIHVTAQRDVLALADLRLRAGDPKGALDLAAPWCPSRPDPALAVAVRTVCFPRPELPLVSERATAWELDPNLPWAIMRAESAFDPTVTSPVGARGLMQIMPAEGPRLVEAAHLGGRWDPDRLYVSAVNAVLGTTELGLRRRSLQGTLHPDALPAVIASYNAGEDAVRRWYAAGVPTDADAFMESVPFTETRRYVRTVLGNLMTWRAAWGTSRPPLDPTGHP
jgi:soluble lytic murein transglycosylase-like protein